MAEPTIYELSSPGRIGVRFPDSDVPLTGTTKGFASQRITSA